MSDLCFYQAWETSMSKNELLRLDIIQKRIFTIRGLQVMLDRDLAHLYDVETRSLKQAVKRNIKRFPDDFMFELNRQEIDSLVSQNVIPSKQVLVGAKPFVFTEQGVANLSSILNNDVAINVNIQIMRAFVAIRRFIVSNAKVFQRLDTLEINQIKTDNKVNRILNALESKDLKPKQGIFFNGQVFDAYTFVADLIRTAKTSIILIDNYVDDTVLKILDKRKNSVKAVIHTKYLSKVLVLDLKKHNAQYARIELKEFKNAHDRFLIIDENTVYHFGASLKDLGKKWFAFSKMDINALKMLEKLNER